MVSDHDTDVIQCHFRSFETILQKIVRADAIVNTANPIPVIGGGITVQRRIFYIIIFDHAADFKKCKSLHSMHTVA